MGTTTTPTGRAEVEHPDLGYDGGSGLHAVHKNMIAKLSDNANSRFFEFTGVNDSTLVTVDHNFGVTFGQLDVWIYTGTTGDLTRVADLSGWTIVATSGNLKTQIDITTPSSGQPHDFVAVVIHGSSVEKLDDLDDVDLVSVPLAVGKTLVWDGTNWVPGASIQNTQISSFSANHTILDADGDRHILVTTSTGTVVLTLPLAANNAERIITFKKMDAAVGVLRITGNGVESIDGVTQIDVTDQFGGIHVFCDGLKWIRLNGLADTNNAGIVLPKQMPGTDTNDNALAGNVGEYIEDVGATSGTLVDSVAQNVHSISLEPGDWDVWGFGNFDVSGADATTEKLVRLLISPAVASPFRYDYSKGFNITGMRNTTCIYRVSIAATTTIYLNAYQKNIAGTAGTAVVAAPTIYARRVR